MRELKEGMVVRIKSLDNTAKEWSSTSGMQKFVGKTVHIKRCNGDDFAKIEEDFGAYVWHPADFVPVEFKLELNIRR